MMKNRAQGHTITVVVVIALVVASAAPGTVVAQEKDWTFTLSPFLWATDLKGTVSIGQTEETADLSFGDILDSLKMAAMADLRIEYGRVALQSNLVWAELQSDVAEGPVKVDVEPTLWIIEVDGRYRLTEMWELLAGIRYYNLHVNLDVDLEAEGGRTSFSASGDENWIDPTLGILFSYPFSERWSFKARGDLGGFGVGSDLAWQLWGLLDYRLGKSMRHSVVVGWRHLDWDYTTGSGDERFAFDAYMTGPVLGLRFRF